MTKTSIPRPSSDEFAPYYQKYIDQMPDGDLASMLDSQIGQTLELLKKNGGKSDFAYAPGKWTVKQVVGHLADAERVFTYRAMRFARNDKTDLPGFDENTYVDNGGFESRTLDDLIEELRGVRAGTVAMARTLAAEQAARRGTANGKEISVRALLWITAGHERHHVAILRDRYGLQG